ncbi:hypothetical protein C9I88_04000 [Photobacterium iliopiscarium]|uniref:Glycosyltransferase 2-like domain-containing protein n=1 Tax=Photobacterium iliopiscarium TaxID=56192 RepID=A0A2T3MPI6_9GAMM|nr:hypothetical protein C9I88_04000 [Photobacterium iliopiscarium]
MFSIVIPLYNKGNYIRNTIHSILLQDYQDFEIIIVDDGSTDNSKDEVLSINDRRIRYFHKNNEGVSSARNYGIEKAQGEYIAFLDADDSYEKEFLSKIFKLACKYPSIDALTSGFYRVKKGVKTTSYLPIDILGDDCIIDDFFAHWSNGAFFCSSSIVVKRSYFFEYNKFFPIGETMGEDQDMWFHLALNGSFAYIACYLSNYNVAVDNSLTSISYNERILELPCITRLKKIHSNNTSKKKFIVRYNLERAINNFIIGNKKEGISIIKDDFFNKYFYKLKLLAVLFFCIPSPLIRKLILIRKNFNK